MAKLRDVLTLVGPSGAGKSTWGKSLADYLSWSKVSIDDEIDRRLKLVLPSSAYVNDTATWLGLPTSAGFAERCNLYLKLEMQEMEEALKSLSQHGNAVLDTTGSVVYMPNEMLRRLTEETTVVYLEGPDSIDEMFRHYIKKPRPVVNPTTPELGPDESERAMIARWYYGTMTARFAVYESLAHVRLSFAVHRGAWVSEDTEASARALLQLIENTL